jgi:hypothetical protein
MVVLWDFVITFVSLSPSFSFRVLLACLTIVPIALLHCLRDSDVEIGCVGLRIMLILSFMCIGFCSWSVEASGLSLAFCYIHCEALLVG